MVKRSSQPLARPTARMQGRNATPSAERRQPGKSFQEDLFPGFALSGIVAVNVSLEKESYVAPLRAAVAITLRRMRLLSPEPEPVAEVCGELLAREGRQRLLYLRNSARARRPEVVQELACRSHALRHAEPSRALELGRLAVRLARCLGPMQGAVALVAEAQAVANLGNLLRLRERYGSADALLRRALRTLEAAGGEPGLKALFLAYHATLRIDQRRAEEAQSLIEECLGLYERLQDRHSIGRARMLLARCYYNRLEPRDALRELRLAASYIDSRQDPALGLDLLHNRFLYLEADGQGELALQLMEQAEELYREYAAPDFVHQAWWLKGRLHTGHGELGEAVRHLEAAHQAYLARNLPYDASLVSLDLALPLARLGLDHLVTLLARQMYAVFLSKKIPREATAALLLFHDAALDSKADAKLIEDLLRELAPMRCATGR